MKDETAWLIEAAGPCYIRVLALSGACGADSVNRFFEWTDDPYKALRFAREEDAEAAMFAIRGLKSDLFPACFPHFPKPVAHMWVAQKADHDVS